MRNTIIGATAALLLASATYAQTPPGPGNPPYGRGPGPGMMGGGPGSGGGYGRGMMGGGPGFDGGPGYGRGAGYGHGMMGGMGMGFATLQDFAAAGIELTPEQQAKVRDIQRDLRTSQWKIMEGMHELMWQEQGFYRDGKFDADGARKRYEAMATYRKQMFENALQAGTKLDAVLTKEQREKLASAER